MKRLFLIFLFLLIACPAWGATYYVSASGSNTSPYDTWAKAANLPETVIALNPASPPHIVLIAPGTYSSYINPTNANWNGGIIYGVSADGVSASADATTYINYPATRGEVSINATAGYHAFYNSASNMQVSNIEFANTDSTHDTLFVGGINFIGRNLSMKNSGRRLIMLNSTDTNLMYFWAEGSHTGVETGTSATGTLSYGIVRASESKYSANKNGVFNAKSSGNFTLNHIILMDGLRYGVMQTGTGTTTFNNSMIFAGHTEGIASRTAGNLILNNCILVRNKMRPATPYFGTVTVNNSITTAYPLFVKRQRSGYVIPSFDDAGDVQYKIDVAAELKSRGMKGTWYIPAAGLTGDTLTAARALVADGTIEIGVHSYSHSNLALTGSIFSITKTGKTITVDRDANTITISDTGSVSGFKTKTLAAIRAELTALGCTLGELPTGQKAIALGEIMADSGGAQPSPYSPQYLIDVTCATGLFKSEIADAKSLMEAALGIKLYSFSTPGGSYSADLSQAVLNAGFTSNRINHDVGGESLLSSINLGKLEYFATLRSLADDATVDEYVRAVSESVASLGCLYVDLMHTATERTVAQWIVALDAYNQYPEIKVTSMYDAVNEIKNSGVWSTTDGITYTRTWSDASNYHLLPGSPAIDAGVTISGLTTDLSGKAMTVIPEIGIYEFQKYVPWVQ